jgi:Zn-finger nucleic acid-binding protein
MEKEVLEDIIVDRCPECGGVWFDGGELEMLSAAIHRAAEPGVPTEMVSRLLDSLLRARPE